MKYFTDYIKIQNRSNFVISNLELYHPEDPRYIPYWKELKEYCIEGLWINEFGGYRFVPPKLFYYANFYQITAVDEVQRTRKNIRPRIRDVEWERFYMHFEGAGFSGWLHDDVYTSNDRWSLYKEKLPNMDLLDPIGKTLFNSKGKLKEYISPKDNIRRIHEYPKGPPIYGNSPLNCSELGARGKQHCPLYK